MGSGLSFPSEQTRTKALQGSEPKLCSANLVHGSGFRATLEKYLRKGNEKENIGLEIVRLFFTASDFPAEYFSLKKKVSNLYMYSLLL